MHHEVRNIRYVVSWSRQENRCAWKSDVARTAPIREVMGEHGHLLVTPVVLGGFGRIQERCTSELDVFDVW